MYVYVNANINKEIIQDEKLNANVQIRRKKRVRRLSEEAL